jgi:serine-type D-Ala-D-Ala carboxypeptidase (penicillin-binding protein 5/6)
MNSKISIRIVIIFISVFISAAISISFFINGQSGIISISAEENQTSQAIASEAGAQLSKITAVSNVENFNFEGSTLPESEDVNIVADPMPKKTENAEPLSLKAKCGVTITGGSDEILFEQLGNEQSPIASISKLATALVFLDLNPGWDKIYKIKRTDRVDGGKIYLFSGDEVKIKDLFYLSLVASDNSATLALVNSTGLSEEEFVARMNTKAKELGLKNTSFVDPIGISSYNISTAKEIALLAKAALDKKEISDATISGKYEFKTLGGKNKIVYNTDSLLKIFPQNGIKILGGKTGYNEAAGYCFVGKFIDSGGHEIIAVVLGGDDINSRFEQTKDMVHWAYNNYQWN